MSDLMTAATYCQRFLAGQVHPATIIRYLHEAEIEPRGRAARKNQSPMWTKEDFEDAIAIHDRAVREARSGPGIYGGFTTTAVATAAAPQRRQRQRCRNCRKKLGNGAIGSLCASCFLKLPPREG